MADAPPTQHIREGSQYAIENAARWIEDANLLLDVGRTPGHAVGLAILALDEAAKAVLWSISPIEKQRFITGILRTHGAEDHALRLKIGVYFCSLARIPQMASQRWGMNLVHFLEQLQRRVDDVGVNTVFQNLDQEVTQLASANELPSPPEMGLAILEDLVQYYTPDDPFKGKDLFTLRELALYVDWHSEDNAFSSPVSFTNEDARLLIGEVATGVDFIARFVHGVANAPLESLRMMQSVARMHRYRLEANDSSDHGPKPTEEP